MGTENHSKFFLKSKTIDAIVVLLVLLAGQLFGVELVNEEITTVAYSALAVVSGILGVWGRIKASKPLKVTP